MHKEHPELDLSSPPSGKISFAKIDGASARNINRLVAQCAEDIVLSSKQDEGIRRLVEKHSLWSIDVDYIEFPAVGENAVYQGAEIVVRERRPEGRCET